MNVTTPFKNLAMAAATLALVFAALLVCAPSAWADTSYGIVKSDGYLHKTNASHTADYGCVWGQNENECRNNLNAVTTLFIDYDVNSIASVKVQYHEWGTRYKNVTITLSGNTGYMGTHHLQYIEFLAPYGYNNCSQMENSGQFGSQESLTTVKGFEKTQMSQVPNFTFNGCHNLHSISLPNGAIQLGIGVFYDCDSLTSITIPASVKTIGGNAYGSGTFANCDALRKVVLNSTTRVSIDSDAFKWTSPSLKFYVPNGVLAKYREDASSNRWNSTGWASQVHPFLEVASVGKATYNGQARKPSVVVSWMGSKLDSGYTVSYSNNVNAGTGKVTVKAKNQTVSKSFTIAKASQPLTVKTTAKKASVAKVKFSKVVLAGAVKAANAKGGVSFAKVSGSAKLTVNKANGKITVAKGTAKGIYKMKVKVHAKGNANYAAGSKTVTVKVTVR